MAKISGTDAWCPANSTTHDSCGPSEWLKWRAETAKTARATMDQARAEPCRRRVSTKTGMVSTAYDQVSVFSAADEGTEPLRAAQNISVSATVLTAYATKTKVAAAGRNRASPCDRRTEWT